MMKPTILSTIAQVFKMYDKRHHRTASYDCLGALLCIILTTGAWGILTTWIPTIPSSYYQTTSGIVRGAQLYYGVVLLVSLLGFLFNTFSPYRQLVASLSCVVVFGICLVTKLYDELPPAEYFGMAITLAIACYLNFTTMIRILVLDSTFAKKWRELTSH